MSGWYSQLSSVQQYIQNSGDFQIFLKQIVSKYLKLFSQMLKSGMLNIQQKSSEVVESLTQP